MEKEAAFILGLLAVKPEFQTRIANQHAIPHLIRMLHKYNISKPRDKQPSKAGAVRRAADAITNLAHENMEIKNMVSPCTMLSLQLCLCTKHAPHDKPSA